MDPKSVTLTEFSRLTGKDRGYLSRIAKQGRLPRNPDGSIPVVEGMKALARIPERPWMMKRAPGAATGVPPDAAPAARPEPPPPQPPPPPPPQVGTAPDDEDVAPSSQDPDLGARLTREKIIAQKVKTDIDRIELAERKREVVPLSDACAIVARAYAASRAELLAIPSHLAGELEGLSARAIEGKLEKAINDALRAIQRIRLDGSPEREDLDG